MDPGVWYIQCPRNENKSFVVYELTTFQRDIMDNCIWIKTPYESDWTQYNSLYFSNGVVGIYDPSDVSYSDLLRIEFEDPLDTLTIKRGLCFSFLNQFELGIENEEVIAGIKSVNNRIHHVWN